MRRQSVCLVVLLGAVVQFNLAACEQCKCQGLNPIDSLSLNFDQAFKAKDTTSGESPAPVPEAPVLEHPFKWTFDTAMEYIKYVPPNIAKDHAIIELGRDTHGHVQEFNVVERFGYNVNSDLQLSLAQGLRFLQLREIEDPAILGVHERSNGPSDLEFGIQYRFLHQDDCKCPVNLQVFASAKAPTGVTNNTKPNGELFETEDQPGTGAWNETIGLSTSKRWGEWAASATYSYTHKGVGSQEYKEGDVNRLSFAASRKMTPDSWGWQLYLSQGLQGFIENKSVDHHVTSPDHGGTFAYAVPGITVIPMHRLSLSASGTVPVYQQENGFHQKDQYGIQFNVGVRF